MKKKVFYIVNLDTKRILFLIIFLLATISSFFTLGLTLGKKSNLSLPKIPQEPNIEVASDVLDSDPKETELEPNPNPAETQLPTENTEEKVEIVVLKENPPPEQETPENIPTENTEEQKKTKEIEEIPEEIDNYYTIQLAAFKSKKSAEELKKSIERRNKVKSYIVKNEKGYYLVRVGRERTKKRIERILRKLKTKYKRNSIIKKM